MPVSPFHVIIIGGGLGGLCLAQGLKKAGISVAVYERDRTQHDRLQGYRIHIEPQGNRALATCLPDELFRRYLATSGSGGAGFRISTEQLKELVFFRAPPESAMLEPEKCDRSVSRITLREILLSGLGDIVHFDKTFTHYQETASGRVTVFFEDGTSASCDLLVAADGGRSRVRKQFLPESELAATGVTAIMGKIALTDGVRSLLLPGQLDTATSILGPQGCAMFLAMHDLCNKPVAHSTLNLPQPGLLFDNHSDYLFWALIARHEKYPHARLQQLDGSQLQQIVLTMIEQWHPRVRQLVRDSDNSTIICRQLHTSRPIKPWASKPITLLGDAIHSMPPTRGIGGNTALRDAQLLCQELIAVAHGERPLLQALRTYEAAMLEYGFAAVRGSIQALELHVAESRLVSNMMLRVMNGFFWLQHIAVKKTYTEKYTS